MSNLQDYLEGFPPLSASVKQLNMTPRRRLRIAAICMAVLLREKTVGRRDTESVFDGLSSAVGHEISALGDRTKESSGDYYLSEDQVREFEQAGVIRVPTLPREEAIALGDWATEQGERGWDGNQAQGAKVRDALTKSGHIYHLTTGGLYQSLFHQNLWDICHREEIVNPLQSLLGNDLLCWRQQFFDKKPGEIGTFWHQSSHFQVTSKKRKLTLLEGSTIPAPMVQLTIWIALDDVELETGALLFAPGSFRDTRMEIVGERLINNPLKALAGLGPKAVYELLALVEYHDDDFPKAQALFEWAHGNLPGFGKDFSPTAYPLEAGEALIFTSAMLHGSLPNITTDRTRRALALRVTTNEVRVYGDTDVDQYPTIYGPIEHSTKDMKCMQISGADRYHHNNIADGLLPATT